MVMCQHHSELKIPEASNVYSPYVNTEVNADLSHLSSLKCYILQIGVPTSRCLSTATSFMTRWNKVNIINFVIFHEVQSGINA